MSNFSPDAPLNEGIAAGGPLNGQELSSRTKTINIPIQGPRPPDWGPGNRGIGAGIYRFEFGMWIYKS